MFILKPTGCPAAYGKAAAIFQEMYQKVTGILLPIKEAPEEKEDIIVIGSDAVQPFAFRKIDGGFPIRHNSDDYCLISVKEPDRNLLFLAGGRGRSTIYAVYDFFERCADCHYFWDGDVIPHKTSIDITGLSVVEQPRFEYRAIRYFAHRGLTRFQAEHWDLEEWKFEIDWILKNRLNTFMLRIGVDDLFQKAFPDIVDYPSNEEVLPEALEGFNNRTTFWPLEYRGQLRKAVLDYAFEQDLMHPEDCGTMTHWYSRTPQQFLDAVKPDFLSQTSKSQSEQTGLVWDIFDEKNLKNYQHLTDTHVKEYGKPELFHTIGLAERTYHEDRKANLDLKRYAYKKIIDYVSENYPNAPLMIAAWDFMFALLPEEVPEITKLFHPEKTMILDYTIDLKEEDNNYEKWDIVGKIPWIFGLFHSYEPQNHIHGDYAYITEKLTEAQKDPFCKGMALWPELSHSDTLMLSFFTENAWKPTGRSIEEVAADFCKKRYGADAEIMHDLWQSFLKTMHLPTRVYMSYFVNILTDRKTYLTRMLDPKDERNEEIEQWWRDWYGEAIPFYQLKTEVYEKFAALPATLLEKPFIHRDVVDMAQTMMTKKLNYDIYGIALSLLDWRRGNGDADTVRKHLNICEKGIALFADIMALHDDYSLYQSLTALGKNRPVNPHFEEALKDNVINWYCRSASYEATKYVYLPEFAVFRNWVETQLTTENRLGAAMEFDKERKEILDGFKKVSFKDMQPEKIRTFEEVMKASIDFLTEWPSIQTK